MHCRSEALSHVLRNTMKGSPPMSEQRLDNTRRFFDEITEKSYRQFMDGEVTFLIIYAMAYGLYHITDWVFHHDLPKVQAKYGTSINSVGDFWHNIVENNITDAGFIRDLNNSAKHAKLSFNPTKTRAGSPSTGMHHAANTFISMTAWGDGGYGVGPFGGRQEVKMDEGGRVVLLEPIATGVFKYWEGLVNEFYPKTAVVISAHSAAPSANS